MKLTPHQVQSPKPLVPRAKNSQKQEPKKPDPVEQFFKSSIAAVGGGLGIYQASSAFAGTYLHEWGHKAAVGLLYQDTPVDIHVEPFKGGHIFAPKLGAPTELGELLGMEGRRAAVHAAGTAMDALSSVACMAAGYQIHKKMPFVGASLMGYAGYRMANSVLYAAGGIGKTPGSIPGHDFLNFEAMTGVPCWVQAVALASLLPLQFYLMRKADS